MESVGPNLVAEKLGYSGRRKYRMDSDEESNKCPANKELTIVIFVMVVGTLQNIQQDIKVMCNSTVLAKLLLISFLMLFRPS